MSQRIGQHVRMMRFPGDVKLANLLPLGVVCAVLGTIRSQAWQAHEAFLVAEWCMGFSHVEQVVDTRGRGDPISERRHCRLCLKDKPDRCHRRGVCKACVLQMHHHCPWRIDRAGCGNHEHLVVVVSLAELSCVLYWVTALSS